MGVPRRACYIHERSARGVIIALWRRETTIFSNDITMEFRIQIEDIYVSESHQIQLGCLDWVFRTTETLHM